MEEPQLQKKKSKGKRSARKREHRQTGKKEKYAYTITDKAFGELNVLNSANAWWIERVKVQHLIDAYKIDANDDEACSYAGITLDQLKYFKQLHPEFSTVKHACHQILGLKAKKALAEKVEEDPQWYLERRRKDEYSTRRENTGAEGRDLYEGLSTQMKNLTEQIANETGNTTEEHTGDNDGRGTSAEQDGSGNEASAAGDTGEAQDNNS